MTPGPPNIRRLLLTQSAGWIGAWFAGLAVLLGVALHQHAALERARFDQELSLVAAAVYGLAGVDRHGRFRAELLSREPRFMEGNFEVWFVRPASRRRPMQVHLAPEQPQFAVPTLEAEARDVVLGELDDVVDRIDAQGRPFRMKRQVSYDHQDTAYAAILVVGDPTPWQRAHAAYRASLVAVALLLSLLGAAVGVWLARRSLAPVLASIEQRQAFLSAAAHELRTPVASLRAVCESALEGDESAEEAMRRVQRIALHAHRLVDGLLLQARLQAGQLQTEPTRLDLLLESIDLEDVTLNLEPCVADVDSALIITTVQTLVDNAKRHGAQPVRVSLTAGGIRVDDDGPGFAPELAGRATEAFVRGAQSTGQGLGLSIAALVAELHGGSLTLGTHPGGGASVTLSLSTR